MQRRHLIAQTIDGKAHVASPDRACLWHDLEVSICGGWRQKRESSDTTTVVHRDGARPRQAVETRARDQSSPRRDSSFVGAG